MWDAKLQTLFGLEPSTFDGTFDAYTALLHPDDRAHVLATVDDAVHDRAATWWSTAWCGPTAVSTGCRAEAR